MKVAISLEDSLLEQADAAARDLGLTRSALIAAALKDYLGHWERARLTAQLNEAYKNGPTPAENRIVRGMKSKLPIADRW